MITNYLISKKQKLNLLSDVKICLYVCLFVLLTLVYNSTTLNKFHFNFILVNSPPPTTKIKWSFEMNIWFFCGFHAIKFYKVIARKRSSSTWLRAKLLTDCKYFSNKLHKQVPVVFQLAPCFQADNYYWKWNVSSLLTECSIPVALF